MTISSILMIFFAVVFWISRVIISFTSSMDIDFPIKPLNPNVELGLCFLTLVCLIFIYRRKMWAAVIYLISYWGYFGVYLYTILKHANEIIIYDYINILISAVGILIPFMIIFDIGFSESSKKTSSRTKKTDWFYQNEQFDRKLDERADKNQYKF